LLSKKTCEPSLAMPPKVGLQFWPAGSDAGQVPATETSFVAAVPRSRS
jgi:hypothetical protein